MAIYMKIDGISGDATQGQHKDWIDIQSFSFGVGRGITTRTGRAQNRESSEPSLSDISITKELDSSSVLLCQEATVGKDGKTVKVDFCRTDKEGTPYLQIILSEVLISGYSTSSGGDRTSESITLNYTKIEYNETGGNAKNGAGQPVKFTYNIATAGSG
jgi:type VI secretion system secreted protein Hcp